MNTKLAIGLLACANILWGSSHAVAKVALTQIPPPLLGALRFSLATGLLWLVIKSWPANRSNRAITPTQIARPDKIRLLLLGLLGTAISYLFAYWGISLTTATEDALMIVGEVIFTALLAAWLIQEPLGLRRGLGISVGIAGVLILLLGNLTGGSAGGTGLSRVAGNLLILVGLFCQAIYSVLGSNLSRKYHPLPMLTLAYSGSLLIWLPVLGWYLFSGNFPALSLGLVTSILYLGTIISVVCFLLWFWVISATNVGMGAVTLLLQPVVGALLGLLFLGDRLSLALLLGGGLIILAIYLTSLPQRQNSAIPSELPTPGA